MKPTNEQIQQYREIVENAPDGVLIMLLLLFYFAGAFVKLDSLWLASFADWGEVDRFMLVLFTFIIGAIDVVIFFAIRDLLKD